MKNVVRVVILSIALAIASTGVGAQDLTLPMSQPAKAKVKKKRSISGWALMVGAVAAGAAITRTPAYIANNLAEHPEQLEDYFAKHPDRRAAVANYLLDVKLNQKQARENYDRYRKLADAMNLGGIPPYAGPPEPATLAHDRPAEELTPEDVVSVHPIPEDSWSNIIVSPEGERIDTSTEFPNREIHDWSDYLYLKAQSKILEERMTAEGKGVRPRGYATHHIVAWDDGRFPECEHLRQLLASNNIDVNDPSNGVYLPTRKVTKNQNEAYHPEIHTETYYMNLWDRLKYLDGDPALIRSELEKVGSELSKNKFPYKRPK